MDLSHLDPLPEWRDHFQNIDKGETWKWKEELEIAEALYRQWREVFNLVSAFAENLPDEEEERICTRSMIYENAYVVAPKIVSACGDTLYQIKMENAALIRFNCRQMWEQVAFAVLMEEADAEHKEVIEEALIKFKELFRRWANTFRRDEYEDEWGYFKFYFPVVPLLLALVDKEKKDCLSFRYFATLSTGCRRRSVSSTATLSLLNQTLQSTQTTTNLLLVIEDN